ncbi:hypothetical protein Droror1_Dr00006738 [Drosera rotundifolia]
MGCNTSKLDDEEAVQLCKDRKRFIKQAVEQRLRFASGHIAYIQSLKKVAAALREYVEGDEPREFLLQSCITPPSMSIKKSNPKFITISPKCFSGTTMESEGKTTVNICYYKAGANPSRSVQETPLSPETVPIQSYSPSHHYGMDGFFTMQDPSRYSYFSPDNRPSNVILPPSPQVSIWDSFWNPFSSLDYYGYPVRSGLDHTTMDDDITDLRQVREEEGIPDLEEETEHEEHDTRRHRTGQQARHVYNYAREGTGRGDSTARNHGVEQRARNASNQARDEVTVEDVDEVDDDDDDDDSGDECEHHATGLQPHAGASAGVEICHQESTVSQQDTKEESPGFTAYVKKRPTSMDEVIKDLEEQFMAICNAANEVSALLEAGRAQYSSPSSELSAMKILNPVALFRSASSRSSSSRFFGNSSSSRDESSDSSSGDFYEESSMVSGSHQSTVGKLFAWEKRLYDEVRLGEKIRLAYEKKCNQLKSQDVKGDDPSAVDKTRSAIQDLHTQIKVSIRSIEAVSKRIEALRDKELQPQILELVLGLSRMWKVMAECHQTQKYTLDEAKYLLAGTPSKLNKAKQHTSISASDPSRLARSAANLETEIRNWRSCFESWITSQRSYVHALTSWLLRCMRCDPDTSKLPFSPCQSSSLPPIFGICIQWSRFLDRIREVSVLDGLDFFAAGMGSVYAQQMREDSRRAQSGSHRAGPSSSDEAIGGMEVIDFRPPEDEFMAPEKMAEVAVRVLCAGMSVAMSSLSEFAVSSAEGYAELVSQWGNTKWPPDAQMDGNLT